MKRLRRPEMSFAHTDHARTVCALADAARVLGLGDAATLDEQMAIGL